MIRAALLAGAGLVLLFTAPPHRLDLLAYGLAATLGAFVWCPAVAPLVIGASLPFYFFGRPLLGPLAFSPPGLALGLAWLAMAVGVVRRSGQWLCWPRTGYDAPLALFLVAALLSLLVTEYPLLSARELRALIFEPVAFFWLLAAVPGSSRSALIGWLLAATATALVAIAQVAFGLGGTEAEGVRRAQAWYPSPNHLALMLGRAMPFVLVVALSQEVPGGRWWWLAAGLVGLALVLTFSTGGWLGGLVAIVVALAAMGRRRLARWLGGAAAVGLLVVSSLAVIGVLPERLNPLRQTGGFRLELWLSSIEMVRDHPLLGVGLDNFAYLYQQVYVREAALAEPNLSHPHNWVLNVWLELGLLGLVAFVWLLLRAWRGARAQRGWLAAGALGSLADMLIHGLFDNSYFLVDLAFLFWLGLALARGRAVRISAT